MAKTTGTFLFLGIMLVAGACSDGGSTPTPPSSATSGGIAFVSERDGNAEIYVVNADGTGLGRLTNDPAEDTGPAWSPDGTGITFASDRDGNFDIYAMNADGTRSRGSRTIRAMTASPSGRPMARRSPSPAIGTATSRSTR